LNLLKDIRVISSQKLCSLMASTTEKRKLRDWTQAVMERMEWEAQRMQEEEDGQ